MGKDAEKLKIDVEKRDTLNRETSILTRSLYRWPPEKIRNQDDNQTFSEAKDKLTRK